MAEVTSSTEQPVSRAGSTEPVIASPDLNKSHGRKPFDTLRKKIAAAAAAATFFNLGSPSLPPSNQETETSGPDSAISASSPNFPQPKQGAEISIPALPDNNSNLILEKNPDLKALVEHADFDTNGSVEIATYKEPPYFSPPGKEFLKIRNATILRRGEPDPKTGSEQVILGVKANEFGGRLVLISGTINPDTVIRDTDSSLLGRGPDTFPKNLDRVDIGVHLDYLKDGPIQTAKDEAINVGSVDGLYQELHGKVPADPNKIHPFVLTRVQSSANEKTQVASSSQ